MRDPNPSSDAHRSNPMTILVTGAAGFIGYHLCRRLLDSGVTVAGVDNLSPYYDPDLKRARLAQLEARAGFSFIEADLADRAGCRELFARLRPARVAHLAAQAGVRHSLVDPDAYIDANLVAFTNVLEGCRRHVVEHLVFASSSSVYGLNERMPFSPHHGVDHPISLYAATKRANELMAHSYSHLFRLPVTGLRFFTVYGPWGRPDMSPFRFASAIDGGLPIDVYNHGKMSRDFTYIDDIVEAVSRALGKIPEPSPRWSAAAPDPAISSAPFRIFNIGNRTPVPLLEYIAAFESAFGRKAVVNLLPMQAGDVESTEADVSDLEEWVGFSPRVGVAEGVARFVDWYREYYGRKQSESTR